MAGAQKATAKKLERVTFTVSRELEYFTESELTTQTGYSKDVWWPDVLVKELVDNSLDACEQAGLRPLIQIRFGDNSLDVSDNGPGIQPDVIRRILDYSTRTSDKQAYVSPTRGAQGNAWKTILAIPYVLSATKEAAAEIATTGLKHTIVVSTDSIARRPRITHETAEIVRVGGTTVRLTAVSPCSNEADRGGRNLQRLILDYSLFNPHATFVLNSHRLEASNPDWRKWLPTDPTSPHWYDPERFESLMASYLAAELNGAKPRTIREFVSEFRGLASTAKQSKVCKASGLARATLRDLVRGGDIDRAVLQRLLSAMQKESKPVNPEALGVLGEQHFSRLIASDHRSSGDTFRYSRQKGFDASGLPYLVECAFAIVESNSPLRGLHVGVNWSVPLGQPFQQTEIAIERESAAEGLSAALARSRIDVQHDPVCLAVHIACPRFRFLDRGKGSLAL